MSKPVVTFYSPEYAQDALRLRESCAKFRYDYDEIQVHTPDNWEGGCAMKPAALLQFLQRHDRIVYLDADEFLTDSIPWLMEFDGDIALAKQPPPPRGQKWRAQRYRLHGERFGERYLSGVMAINRSRLAVQVITEWARLCEQYPSEWDEFLLQLACQRIGFEPDCVADDHRVIPLNNTRTRIGHRSGSNRHWRLSDRRYKPERKVVLLGSAPYVPEWWQANGEQYLSSGFSPVCMNNSWKAIPLSDVHYWIRPYDFRGEEPPQYIPRNSELGSANANLNPRRVCEHRMWWCWPDWDRRLYTTLTHSLYHLANEAYYDGVKLIVHVVGSDFDYRGPNTHFYGKGKPDPLRHGVERLQQALLTVKHMYEHRGHSVYNAGGQDYTLLPFARAEGHDTTEEMFMITPRILSKEEMHKANIYVLDQDLFKTKRGLVCGATDAERKYLVGRKGEELPMREAVKLGLVIVRDDAKQNAKATKTETHEENSLVTAGELVTANVEKRRGRPRKT